MAFYTKRYLLFTAFALLALSHLGAQNNFLKIGPSFGRVPYETSGAWGGEVQYEHLFGRNLHVFGSIGMLGRDFSESGRSMGSEGMVTWDNSWESSFSESFRYLELGVKDRLFTIGDRYAFKVGTGLTLGQAVFKYPETLFIERGIITQREDVTHRAEVFMIYTAIEQQFKLNDRFFIALNAALRTHFKEKHVLERRIDFDYGSITTTSGIRAVPTLSLQMGYAF